jgi:hypothetical protein
MAACLRAIARDPDAEVLRIKNRLDPGFDPALSAGYRDVSLSLRIATAETRALGVDLHVCELQLLLRAFHALKVNDRDGWRARNPPRIARPRPSPEPHVPVFELHGRKLSRFKLIRSAEPRVLAAPGRGAGQPCPCHPETGRRLSAETRWGIGSGSEKNRKRLGRDLDETWRMH